MLTIFLTAVIQSQFFILTHDYHPYALSIILYDIQYRIISTLPSIECVSTVTRIKRPLTPRSLSSTDRHFERSKAVLSDTQSHISLLAPEYRSLSLSSYRPTPTNLDASNYLSRSFAFLFCLPLAADAASSPLSTRFIASPKDRAVLNWHFCPLWPIVEHTVSLVLR